MIDVSGFTGPDDGRKIFAVRGLPPEVIATLFAFYSRRAGDLRSALRQMIAEEPELMQFGLHSSYLTTERAREFHEKWVVGYGHGSVAEHAVVHLAVEGVSVLAAKAIEEHRLASYTEQSTRFRRFDRAEIVRDIGLPKYLQGVYEDAVASQMDCYRRVVESVGERLSEQYRDQGVSEAMIRTKACDLSRGLLPIAVTTNLGVTVNARELAHMISSLRTSPLAEVVDVADGFCREGQIVAPTLLRHTDPYGHVAERRRAVERLVEGGCIAPPPVSVSAWPEVVDDVHVHHVATSPISDIASAIVEENLVARGFGTASLPLSLGFGSFRVDSQPLAGKTDMAAYVSAYMRGRGPYDRPGRALECVGVTAQITADFGAWRDLQRHRLVSSVRPCLTPQWGYARDRMIDALGMGEVFHDSMRESAVAWRKLVGGVPPEVAQYVLPMAWRVRWRMHANLREVISIIELRSAKAGHPAYRRVVQDLARQLTPILGEDLFRYVRVDTNEYEFARDEKRSEVKS